VHGISRIDPAGGVALARTKLGTMNEHQASRTLLKSPPELWAECSDAQSLARHLDTFFGEIRITRLEPESTVAWEGERGSGTVKLESSGWGTRVTLTCSTATVAELEPEPVADPEPEAAAEPEPEAAADPEPEAAAEPEPAPTAESAPSRGGLLTRVMRLFAAQQPPAEPPPAPPAPERSSAEPPSPAPESPKPEPPTPESSKPEPSTPQATEPDEAADRLTAALDSLGQAHHRPFSRA
jgi:hypothetical protein